VRRLAPPRREPAKPLQSTEAIEIVKAVAFETGLRVDAILDRNRVQKLVRARAAVAWLTRRTTDLSLPRIGVAIGGRDHSMVLYLIHKAEGLRDTDPAFRLLTDRLHTKLSEVRS
jgi:chromosomal replication initiator protein